MAHARHPLASQAPDNRGRIPVRSGDTGADLDGWRAIDRESESLLGTGRGPSRARPAEAIACDVVRDSGFRERFKALRARLAAGADVTGNRRQRDAAAWLAVADNAALWVKVDRDNRRVWR